MKSFTFVLILLYSSCTVVFAQQCIGENPVSIVLKGYKTDYKLTARNASFQINLNDGIFYFNVPLTQFISLDTTQTIEARTFLEEVFEEEYHPDLYYSGQFPIAKLDKETDNMQKMQCSGTLVMGDVQEQALANLEIEYMDRELMYNFLIVLTPQDLVMSIPDKYKKYITGVIEIRGDYLKLVVRN